MKKRKKKILLSVLAGVLGILVLLAVWALWLPGIPHSIDFFPQYHGILDTPIERVTLYRMGGCITFTDEDLISPWQEGLSQLRLQKNETRLIPFAASGNYKDVEIYTETGRYLLTLHEDNRLSLGPFYFTADDPENLPFDETYEIAYQRYGLTLP